jgi:hypothetical protein
MTDALREADLQKVKDYRRMQNLKISDIRLFF